MRNAIRFLSRDVRGHERFIVLAVVAAVSAPSSLAVAAAERARKLNPSVPQGARWLAELYRRQGRLDEAQKLESSFAAPAAR